LDEIGLVAYEEMSFKVKVYGRTDVPTFDVYEANKLKQKNSS
jgi:hypothetical protein